MSETNPPDSGAFFRELFGQWEGLAGQFGASAAGAKAKEAMSRALAAANMPTREDMTDVTARMRGVEARLERIETLLAKLVESATAAPAPEAPSPKKPPKKAK